METILHSLYHLATADCWNRQQQSDGYEPDAFRSEGFVHCCTREQLAGVASRYYRNSADLMLLVLDQGKLRAELIFENTMGGTEQFPHLYGPVNRDAIVSMHPCAVTSDGEFLPSLDEILFNGQLP